MNTANLTRFGPENFSQPTGACVTYSASFRAINGPAKLIVQNHGVQQLELKINGRSIDFSLKTEQNSEIQLDIILQPNNTLEVTLEGNLSIRVTQITHADLGLLRQGYFGLNTTDLARQRKFYETLGFIGEIYPAGPETSTRRRTGRCCSVDRHRLQCGMGWTLQKPAANRRSGVGLGLSQSRGMFLLQEGRQRFGLFVCLVGWLVGWFSKHCKKRN